MTKKALIISYYWPPSGGSGVQRWMYFAKYLGENGIEPTVITINPQEAAYPAIDESLLKHTENVRVIHTSGGFQVIQLYSKLKGGSATKEIPVGDFGSKKKTRFDKIAGYIRANYFIPDARVGWAKRVIPVARKLLSQEKFDFIITTGPPHSTHLVGLALKKEFPIKWLADFRDPWREIYYNNLFKRSVSADKKDAKLEMSVIKNADCILTVGPSLQQLLAEKLPEHASKFCYVLNGFDHEMFAGKKPNRYSEFTLAHIGIWTIQQPFEELAQALESLLKNQPDLNLRLLLAGRVDEPILNRFKLIDRLLVDYRGKISHPEAIQEMLNANLLLNCLSLHGDTKILISGKTMEYLATGNAFLAIGNTAGDANKIMQEFPNTFMAEPGDVHQIQGFIQEQLFKSTSGSSISLNIAYSRKSTTKQLAQILMGL